MVAKKTKEKQTPKRKRKWLSKSRYYKQKRKEEDTQGKTTTKRLVCPPNQECFVYHIENTTATDTYVGYTTTPKKRIRQHNGELVGGARRTRGGRPWSFGFILSFDCSWFNKIHAQQLEYACKHFNKRRKYRLRTPQYIEAIPGHPSITKRLDHLLWALHHVNQFTSNFPVFDPLNSAHHLQIYVSKTIQAYLETALQQQPALYWSPQILCLSNI